ncbi:hypothetical protein ACFL4U_02535 [Candidatus Neomarinimicrobiota bacterium]
MKCSLALLPALVLFGVLLSCNKDQPQDDDLALYLLIPDTLNAIEAADLPLDSLVLADEPILSLSEIKTYDWSDHSFTITSTAYNRIENILEESATHSDLRGVPFVIMVEEERIYLGAFWNPVSSIPWPCSAITFPPLTESPLILNIIAPWRDVTPDQRSDHRIREVLDAAGVLQE